MNDINTRDSYSKSNYQLALSIIASRKLTILLNEYFKENNYSFKFTQYCSNFLVAASLFINDTNHIIIPDLFAFLDSFYSRYTMIQTYYYLQRIKIIKKRARTKSFYFTPFGFSILHTIDSIFTSLNTELASKLQQLDNQADT